MIILQFSRKLTTSFLHVMYCDQALRYLVFHRLDGVGSKCIIWRRECHVSMESGIHGDDSWLSRAVYVMASRAVQCKRSANSSVHNSCLVFSPS